MNSISWVIGHWSQILTALGEIITVVSLVVASLPQSASKNKAVAILEQVSYLTHHDSPGTLKMPGTSAVREVIPPAADHTAE